MIPLTKEAIKKLPDKCRSYCETISVLISRAILDGRDRDRMEYSKKLRGYVECLHDLGVLSQYEMRAVYMYYATAKNTPRDT